MKGFIGALAALALATPAGAATDPADAAAIAVVQRLFDAMAAQDGAAIREIVLPGTVLTSIRPGPDGVMKLSRIPIEDFIANLKPGFHEEMWSARFARRGMMIATVTAPYEFKRGGKTSHCGVDVFDLVRVDGQWRVASGIWTAEPDACAELRRTR